MTPNGGVPPRRSRCTRHILFQTTLHVDLVRTESEEALATLLAVPDDFAACALVPSNCPSGDQAPISGGSAGRRRCQSSSGLGFGCRREGSCASLSRHATDFTSPSTGESGGTLPFEVALDHVAERLKAGVEERHAGNTSPS